MKIVKLHVHVLLQLMCIHMKSVHYFPPDMLSPEDIYKVTKLLQYTHNTYIQNSEFYRKKKTHAGFNKA